MLSLVFIPRNKFPVYCTQLLDGSSNSALVYLVGLPFLCDGQWLGQAPHLAKHRNRTNRSRRPTISGVSRIRVDHCRHSRYYLLLTSTPGSTDIHPSWPSRLRRLLRFPTCPSVSGCPHSPLTRSLYRCRNGRTMLTMRRGTRASRTPWSLDTPGFLYPCRRRRCVWSHAG